MDSGGFTDGVRETVLGRTCLYFVMGFRPFQNDSIAGAIWRALVNLERILFRLLYHSGEILVVFAASHGVSALD